MEQDDLVFSTKRGRDLIYRITSLNVDGTADLIVDHTLCPTDAHLIGKQCKGSVDILQPIRFDKLGRITTS